MTAVELIVKYIRDKDEKIDKDNVNTEKLPEYAQKIIGEYISKYYSHKMSGENHYDVFTEFADSIRPHLAQPYLPIQELYSKDRK